MRTCIRDGCGKPFDPAVPETRDSTTLRAFWQRYCPKHRVPAEPPVIITNSPDAKQVLKDLLAYLEQVNFNDIRIDEGLNLGHEGKPFYDTIPWEQMEEAVK